MAKWIKLGRYHEVLQDVVSEEKDDDIHFNELCALLEMLGCKLTSSTEEHHIFIYDDAEEQIDLQTEGTDFTKAKREHVEQVREFIKKYIDV